MGRTGKHLRYSVVSVKPSGESRSDKAFASFWAADLNDISIDNVYASTTEQCYFRNLCGKHYSKQSPKSLHHNFVKRNGTSLDCKACKVYNWESHSSKPSQYESAAYSAVFHLPADLQVPEHQVLIDHKLLGKDFSAVDIFLPCHNLCIMVDGEGHFTKHHGLTAQKQETIDYKFNTEAIKNGHRVLRLHYDDAGLYAAIVKVAVRRCKSNIFGSIDFSKSYGQLIRKAWGLKPLV